MRLADVTGRPLASACTNTGFEAGRPLTLCSKGVRVRHVHLAVLVSARTLDRLTERGEAAANLLRDWIPARGEPRDGGNQPVPRSVSLWGAA